MAKALSLCGKKRKRGAGTESNVNDPEDLDVVSIRPFVRFYAALCLDNQSTIRPQSGKAMGKRTQTMDHYKRQVEEERERTRRLETLRTKRKRTARTVGEKKKRGKREEKMRIEEDRKDVQMWPRELYKTPSDGETEDSDPDQIGEKRGKRL